MPQIAPAAAADLSTVPSSATSVIDNLTSSAVTGSPATSTTYVPLSTVAGNGTVPLKGAEEILDEESVASTTTGTASALHNIYCNDHHSAFPLSHPKTMGVLPP
ncbi:hypothetical protein F5887DRAFT_1075910 [Amanita rubescens]|nr:hypothetical protein F5887DRAFT_1075910 [Amanita rubescens]